MDEQSFLNAILAAPNDSAPRLIYADWLDEKNDLDSVAKATFLRSLETRDADPKGLQRLAADLDPGWLAVVSRLPIENCQEDQRNANEVGHKMVVRRLYGHDYRCGRRWDELQVTNENGIRFCDTCNHHVHYCDTIMSAREHAAEGHCVAVDLGIIRREGDLEPEHMWLGMPSVETLKNEEERLKPDAVSLARERRKRDHLSSMAQ